MSLRGNSGIGHRNLNADIIGQMRQTADYDLIILEFGINALSSDQSNYSYYAKAMTQAVQAIQSCYPNSIVMLMGIGDRGHKQGGQVVSMHTCPAMVAAQRSVAPAPRKVVPALPSTGIAAAWSMPTTSTSTTKAAPSSPRFSLTHSTSP